jgi:hypothetical protein
MGFQKGADPRNFAGKRGQEEKVRTVVDGGARAEDENDAST